ncbi:MAG: hypothetical protein P0119_06305 [Nitrospira sp.]|nr:hypothetical protein [Nitrospira sp.]
MTTDEKLLNPLKAIATIPLWGEPITNPEHGDKEELAEFGEYDLDNDLYQPSVDAESSWLTYAVETARAAFEDETEAIRD